MADSKYFSIVTDLGTTEMMKAIKEGGKVDLLHFAVGDGGGEYFEPDITMTALKNEVWRGTISSCTVSGESENILIAETVVPSDTGGFTIREMAVFDKNNIMIAVCNTPDTAKVCVTDGIVHELNLKMEILLNNKDSVQLVIDPNVVTATKKDLENLKKELMETCAIACEYHQGKEEILIKTGGGGQGQGYTLPVASRETIGGVKIGQGITIANDGTISVDAEQTAEMAAGIVEKGIGSVTPEDVKELFD